MAALLLAFGAAEASAQTWTAPHTWSTGELVTSSLLNTHVRDNELVLRAGGFSVTSQAIGDLLCASSTTQFGRLADVATGQVIVSGGVGACPSYSATLPAAVQTNITQLGTLTTSPLTVSSSNTYVRTLSAATNNDSAVRVSDGSTEWYMGMLGATVGTGGSFRLYTAGNVWLQLSTAGVLNLGATNVTHTIGATGTGAVIAHFLNTAGSLFAGVDSSTGASFGTGNYAAVLLSDVSGGLSIGSTHASGVLREYAGGALRWGISAAGDRVFGSSSHIADSGGTPTIFSGFGTSPSIAGNDYAFTVTVGTGANTGGTVEFGHLFTNLPVCAVSAQFGAVGLGVTTVVSGLPTHRVSVAYSSSTVPGQTIFFICRGY